MSAFLVYKKDTGDILRLQEGWHGDITEAAKSIIIKNDYNGDPNVDIMIIDSIGAVSFPENKKVQNIDNKLVIKDKE